MSNPYKKANQDDAMADMTVEQKRAFKKEKTIKESLESRVYG